MLAPRYFAELAPNSSLKHTLKVCVGLLVRLNFIVLRGCECVPKKPNRCIFKGVSGNKGLIGIRS